MDINEVFDREWAKLSSKEKLKFKVIVVACVLLLYSQPFTEAFLGW